MGVTTVNTIDYAPESWGWKPDFLASWASLLDERPELAPLVPARVTRREHHLYEIVRPDFSGRHPAGTVPPRSDAAENGATDRVGVSANVRVSGRFEHEAAGPADYPVAGDWVLVDPGRESARVHATLARRTALSRGSAGSRCDEQVLAANVDVIFLVFALDGGRNFLPRFLERALVVVRNSGASPCIVLNKADLASEADREAALRDASEYAPGSPVVALSAKTGEGVGDLARFLSPGETASMLGKSGVGKSALVNALERVSTDGELAGESHGEAAGEPNLAREGRVREDDLRGRHTTTSSRLYRLDSGILLIDSPGIRELKVWGEAEGLDGGFPEIAEMADRCRFSDCAHADEPGCAVRAALASGELDEARFLSYLALVKEQAWVERRNDDRARQENERKWKQISKFQKELKHKRR